MGLFRIEKRDRIKKYIDEENFHELLRRRKFESFNPNILNLGDISQPSNQIAAVCAIVDLSGFTNFCQQVDPQLAVPEYLSSFLTWFFDELRQASMHEEHKEGIHLYSSLPFYLKFLGDGVLLLWDSEGMESMEINNIVVILWNICSQYKSDFLPRIRTQVSRAPEALRCGISRGHVFSVGNGEDYVGACINIAARLQKLGSLSFVVSRRGFNLPPGPEFPFRDTLIVKKVEIRGIGDGELVYVVEEEFDQVRPDERNLFSEP